MLCSATRILCQPLICVCRRRVVVVDVVVPIVVIVVTAAAAVGALLGLVLALVLLVLVVVLATAADVDAAVVVVVAAVVFAAAVVNFSAATRTSRLKTRCYCPRTCSSSSRAKCASQAVGGGWESVANGTYYGRWAARLWLLYYGGGFRVQQQQQVRWVAALLVLVLVLGLHAPRHAMRSRNVVLEAPATNAVGDEAAWILSDCAVPGQVHGRRRVPLHQPCRDEGQRSVIVRRRRKQRQGGMVLALLLLSRRGEEM